MAFKMNKTLPVYGGIDATVENAYGRIRALHGNKDNLEIEFSWFKDSDSPQMFFTEHFWFKPKLEGDNFLAQAYAYLKSLPQFVDAVEC